MENYHNLVADVLENGDYVENRTGTNTISVISRDLRWDLSKGFPLITTKKMATKAIFGELLWFLSGETDIKSLRTYTELSDTDFCIWQKNLEELNERRYKVGKLASYLDNEDLGEVYGKMWRDKRGHDQISGLIRDIEAVKADPSHPAARRLIVDTWDSKYHTDSSGLECALPPCHYGFQCFVRNGKLSLKWHQRSVDVFLGLPFNIASYALLTHILASLTGLEVGELIFSGGDVHIYEDHVEQCREQIQREEYELPNIKLPEFDDLDDLVHNYTASYFVVENYKHHSALKAVMS